MGRDGATTRVRFVHCNLSSASLTFNSNYDEAIRVMQRAAAVPKNIKINYHDHVS